jgi:hypothetical protein
MGPKREKSRQYLVCPHFVQNGPSEKLPTQLFKSRTSNKATCEPVRQGTWWPRTKYRATNCRAGEEGRGAWPEWETARNLTAAASRRRRWEARWEAGRVTTRRTSASSSRPTPPRSPRSVSAPPPLALFDFSAVTPPCLVSYCLRLLFMLELECTWLQKSGHAEAVLFTELLVQMANNCTIVVVSVKVCRTLIFVSCLLWWPSWGI